MKKKMLTLTIMIACVAMIALFCGTGYAAVTGPCVDCHTMHNSQGGAEMATFGDETGANSALVRGSCMGCHTGTSDPLDDTTDFPYVNSSTSAFSDDLCLAGGFFPATAGTGNNDDNHHGIGNTNDPAGIETGSFYDGTTGLSCAGLNGCHGNETDTDNMAAISGGHHNPTGAYRILSVGGTDVIGYGAADYEELIITTPATEVVTTVGSTQNVNLYSAGVSDPSISELCAKCHGDFHNESGTSDDAGSSGAWIRHPTDIAIPTSWDIGSTTYTPDGNDYKQNPVGYDDASFDITAKRVICLSCHRAHGTENADLLRWAYSTQSAGNSAAEYGCLGCHNKQR
ncbi:MAG: hypothetical protein JRD93_16890 [Deltaproteobacteria bacterium]|nr:hypothetical protein [Deltaproteobacteria bacterium]